MNSSDDIIKNLVIYEGTRILKGEVKLIDKDFNILEIYYIDIIRRNYEKIYNLQYRAS